MASVAWGCCPDSQWLCGWVCPEELDDELEELEELELDEELEELELDDELLLDDELELEDELEGEPLSVPPQEDRVATSSATPAI